MGVPRDVVIVSWEPPVPPEVSVTVVGFTDGVGPLFTIGKTVDDSVTVPAKPLILVRIMEVLPEEPATREMKVELVRMVKSGVGGGLTVKVKLAVRVVVLLKA